MLEYVPSSFKVIRHVRPKLSCRACETIVQEHVSAADRARPARPQPDRPCAGGEILRPPALAPPGRHLWSRGRGARPLDAGRLGRAGYVPACAPGRGGRPPRPGRRRAARRRHHRARARPRPGQDQDRTALGPGARRAAPVSFADITPWDRFAMGSDVPPAAFYRYSADRRGIHAQALLDGCHGFLHADGYAGFNALYAPDTPSANPLLTEVACWSHTIRTQLRFGRWGCSWPRHGVPQWNDMLDLDVVVIIARQSRWESATIKVGKSLLARGVGRAEPDRRREQAEAWPDVPPGGRRAW